MRSRYLLILIPGLVAVAIALTFSGCGDDARRDAESRGQKVDRTAAEVIAMPDQFRNIAHKCDGHGHRVYMNSTGDSGNSANIFVINDPSCSGGKR